jgi:predicted Zn-dependent protease
MDLGPDMAEKLELLMEDKGRKGSTNLIWFFGIVLTLVLGYWGITSAYRAGIEAAADAVPQEWQARLGEAGASSIMQESYLWDHREAQNLLDQLGERLEGELSEKEQSIDFEFYIIDQPAVNAFALPGGKIFFYRGLLEEAETVDEIAGVMAHEMIHVTKSHGLRNLLNQIGLTVALTIFLGDVQGLEQIIFQNVASLGALSYGREQETEADIKGLELIYAAGLDPEGMIAFFQKLLEDNEYDFSAEIFSTHPDTKNRIQVLKDLMAEMGDLEDPWLEKPNFDFDLSSGQAVRY